MVSQRIRRRRALAAIGATAAGAAVLAACGGGSNDGDANGDATKKNSLLSEPEDTTKKAVRGGVWQTSRTDDATTLDVITNISSLSWTDMLQVYSHLVKAGLRSNKPDAFEGDAAQSWEVSPDGLQVTFKMRPDVKFDPRPPTSGRAMTTADVAYSWDAFKQLSPYRSEVFNSLSPAAPISSVSAPDDRTLIVKLAFPYGAIVEMVGFGYYLYVMPKERESFDLRSQMRGRGPFRLADYQPSVALEYTRNPDYHVKDRPFLDGIRRAIIPDYATGLAQFESKALWNFVVKQEDVLRVKRGHSEMIMLQDRDVGVASLASTPYIALSQQPSSPLRDVRVRRAASMMIDRDAWINTFYNTDVFAKEGLPVETLWNAQLPTGSPNWIDPRKSEIGEGGKNFQFNPAEAKKLVEAAGHKNVRLPYFMQNRPTEARQNEVLANMIAEGGLFTVEMKQLDYNTEWRDVCQRSAGDAYAGFCQNNSGGFNEDAYLVAKYTPGGKYAVSNRSIDGVTDAVLKARQETDPKKRSEMVVALQRKLATEMTDIPLPGRAYQFSLRWPWLKNHGAFITGGASSLEFAEHWYDASAKT
jgi:ABC-type transport system substrate-binding protein